MKRRFDRGFRVKSILNNQLLMRIIDKTIGLWDAAIRGSKHCNLFDRYLGSDQKLKKQGRYPPVLLVWGIAATISIPQILPYPSSFGLPGLTVLCCLLAVCCCLLAVCCCLLAIAFPNLDKVHNNIA